MLSLFPEKLEEQVMSKGILKGYERVRAQTELIDYLKDYYRDELSTGSRVKPEQFTSQQERLLHATREKFNKYHYSPVIELTDIWKDTKDRDPLVTTFWELIFTEHFVTGYIKIVNIGYDGTYSASLGHGELPLPYVEFRVEVGSLLQKVLEPPKLQKIQLANEEPVKQRVRLIMAGNFIFAELGNGKRYKISKKELRTDLAPYCLMKYLTKYPTTTITLDNVKKIDGCEDVRNLGEVIRQCGFDEYGKRIFLAISTANKVRLKEDIYLSIDEAALLAK